LFDNASGSLKHNNYNTIHKYF